MNPTADKFQILFVCSGNICRSPMAEGYLKRVLPPRFRDRVEVRSAGTLGIRGEPPSPEAIQVMEERDVDISGHRSQGITPELVEASNLILGMAYDHLEYLRYSFPEASERVFLLRAFEKPDPSFRDSIPDPIGTSIETYRKVRDIIIQEINDLLPRLIQILNDHFEEDG